MLIFPKNLKKRPAAKDFILDPHSSLRAPMTPPSVIRLVATVSSVRRLNETFFKQKIFFNKKKISTTPKNLVSQMQNKHENFIKI